MALDNAQFMSELSITDPPGTDPLSEGDDQIRTAKRTQLQSFPGVDKAVTTTADELNDLAILGDINVFRNRNEFQGQLTSADGLASAPGYSFTNNANMGMFRKSADVLGFGIAGVERFSLSSTLAIFNAAMHVANGTAVLPSYTFANDTGTGMRLVAAGTLSFSVSGVAQFSMTTSDATFGQQLRTLDGTAGAPGHSFTSNSNVGMYIDAQNDLAFAVGLGSGVLLLKTGASAGVISMPLLQTGSAGLVSGDLFKSVGAPGFIEIVP